MKRETRSRGRVAFSRYAFSLECIFNTAQAMFVLVYTVAIKRLFYSVGNWQHHFSLSSSWCMCWEMIVMKEVITRWHRKRFASSDTYYWMTHPITINLCAMVARRGHLEGAWQSSHNQSQERFSLAKTKPLNAEPHDKRVQTDSRKSGLQTMSLKTFLINDYFIHSHHCNHV